MDIAGFIDVRLADDERFMQVMTEAGVRKAANVTPEDLAVADGIEALVMADPEARAEIARWPEGGVMPPTTTERVLAGIAVNRALVAAYRGSCGPAWEALHGLVLTLAACWSAHPDYDASWTLGSPS
jgi:Family of unknown function (DUF6221)